MKKATSTILLIVALAFSWTASASADVHTTATEHRTGEIAKILRITPNKWGKGVSVMSLPPSDVSSLNNGDYLEAAADIEVSVCLKPNLAHGGVPQPCPGKYHDFQPKVSGKLIITGSKRGTQGVQLGKEKTILCTHKQPDRNHHCVVSVPWQGKDISDVQAPCLPNCYVNMILSAYNKNANPSKHKMSIGSMSNNGKIEQGKGKLSVIVHEGERNTPERAWKQTEKSRTQIGVAAEDTKRRSEVVMSQRVDNLRAGDQLRVYARSAIDISNLPYNALMRTEVILADSPNDVDPSQSAAANKIADSTTRISASNGFNCTQGGPSGFKTPCYADKMGILSVRQGNSKPLYVNLTVNLGANGPTTLTDKWSPSDKAIVANGGFIEVEEYRGSSSCDSCQVSGGAKSFDQASSAQDKALVNSIREWGVQDGRYSCFDRDKEYVCDWTSTGSYNGSPKYECDQKAFGHKNSNGNWIFDTKPCKDALAKSLWGVLLGRDLMPDYTGVCQENDRGARCKWYADNELGKFCKGYAQWLIKGREWQVDPCRP